MDGGPETGGLGLKETRVVGHGLRASKVEGPKAMPESCRMFHFSLVVFFLFSKFFKLNLDKLKC